MADNRHFDVRDDKNLRDWMRCCCGRETALGYDIHGGSKVVRLVFYWAIPESSIKPFPFKAGADFLTQFVEEWLPTVDPGPEPDHDGSNQRGFRIFNNEDWAYVGSDHYAFLAVEPAWLMYGK